MEKRPLDAILRPSSVAVVGASRTPNTIGHQIVHNLVAYGFTGPVYPINPKATAICSIPALHSVSELPREVDLAVISVPKQHVLEAAELCGQRGVKGLVVITAGFKEVGGPGIELEQRLLAITRGHGMRMIGPNCMGVLNTDPAFSMNATFAPTMPPNGGFAFMSQSGALGLSVIDYAADYGIGIAQFVSVGNKADVSGNDLLVHWEDDPTIDVILMYVENFGNPRRFLEIAARVTRKKPIVALKAGRSRIGASAAASHTGALAASDVAVDALLAQAGVLRASSMEELFDMAIAFGSKTLPRSRRTVVLTNAGGPGILAADGMAAHGLELPELAASTVEKLRAVLPAEASLRNPLDMIASAQPASYRAALDAVLDDPGVDAAVAIFVPPMGIPQEAVAEAVGAAASCYTEKPTMAVLMGRNGLQQGRNELRQACIPAYIFPESAARGLAALNRYREWLAREDAAMPELSVDRSAATAVLCKALTEQRNQLNQQEALDLLAAYGVPVVQAKVATDAAAAVRAAEEVGFPVVLKLVSPDVVHKTEVGAVRLDIRSAAEVREAYESMVARVRKLEPQARIEGVLVQRMLEGSIEIIVGGSRDPVFGPLIMFGLGGVFVEALRDVAFRVAPLKPNDAADLVNSIRGQKMLDGFRGASPVNREALHDVLLRVSALMLDFPSISELDLNPLLAVNGGVVAVDARVSVTG